jgi:hypothetical protein
MTLPLGLQRTSSVDNNFKPWDVYAVNLTAGQQVRFRIESMGGCKAWTYSLAYPGSESFPRGVYTAAFELRETCISSAEKDFVAPVTGTYYLAVIARDTSWGYTVSLSLKPR